jgi:hypothetical protein
VSPEQLYKKNQLLKNIISIYSTINALISKCKHTQNNLQHLYKPDFDLWFRQKWLQNNKRKTQLLLKSIFTAKTLIHILFLIFFSNLMCFFGGFATL